MSNSTNFVNQVTTVQAAWLNDIDQAVYDINPTLKSLGAIGDGVTDDSTIIQAAVTAGGVIDLGGFTYLVGTKITFGTAGVVFRNGTLKYNGTNATRLVDVTANNITFQNIVFDANSKQPRSSLVYVTTNIDRPVFINCTFKNILGNTYGTNALNQTAGLNINPYGVTNFEIVNCLFYNLRKYNDGSVTPAAIGLGFIGGIYFLPEDMTTPAAAQTTITRGIIKGCTFDTIKTILAGSLTDNQVGDYDDGDAIRTLPGAAGVCPRLDVHISNCKFIDCSKRAFKLRASGGVAVDCEVYCVNLAYGMSVPIDITYNCMVDNIKIFTTSSLPCISVAAIGHGGDTANLLSKISNVYCSHNKTGIQLLSVSGVPFVNVEIDGITLPNASISGILQSNSTPCTTQSNLVVKNINVIGSGNNCQGLLLSSAADNTGGWFVRNVTTINADWKIEGINNDVAEGLLAVTSTSFAGSSSSRTVFEFGSGKGLGGFNYVNNITFNLSGINTSYTTASRPYLLYASSDNLEITDITITTPDGLSTTYPHFEGIGDDSVVDGLSYTGVGFLRFGHLVASSRWAVKNAVRKGSGACSTSFWMLSAAAQYYEYQNITDFRPTTATTIVSATATNGIASNVNTRSSNGTPAVSGVAKTANLNTF